MTDQSRCITAMDVSIRAMDAGVPKRSQSSDGRHVGQAGESSTILPLAFGSHFTNSVLSLNFGSTMASAVTGLPLVPGLQASMVPASDRTRGWRRSMCDVPRRHPRHVPYCSRLASMPHALYLPITQSLAERMPGLPVRRGPMESNSVCESSCTCELSMPSRQIRWRLASDCAAAGAAHNRAAAPATDKVRSRVMAWESSDEHGRRCGRRTLLGKLFAEYGVASRGQSRCRSDGQA